MQDLAAETPEAFSEEAYDSAEGIDEEGFAEDALEEMDAYEASGDDALALEEDDFEADLGEDFGEFEGEAAMDAAEELEEAMADAFETDVMDDLFYESVAGPAQMRYADEFEDLDAGEDEFDASADGFEDDFEALDEFDAADAYESDEMLDWAEDEEAIDAAAPVIAGLALRSSMPGASAWPAIILNRVSPCTTILARSLACGKGRISPCSPTPVLAIVPVWSAGPAPGSGVW